VTRTAIGRKYRGDFTMWAGHFSAQGGPFSEHACGRTVLVWKHSLRSIVRQHEFMWTDKEQVPRKVASKAKAALKYLCERSFFISVGPLECRRGARESAEATSD
jgi:hypothetical protein